MTPNTPRPQIVWLRRDLRLQDHAALSLALRYPEPILPVFIFDQEILDPLKTGHDLTHDSRVAFIYGSLKSMHKTLQGFGAGLHVVYGRPVEALSHITDRCKAVRVIYAGDDEPDALVRDEAVRVMLQARGIDMLRVKDQSIFERQELLTGGGRPYSVFTPYKNAWLKKLQPKDYAEQSCAALGRDRLWHGDEVKEPMPSLQDMGFDEAAHQLLRLGCDEGHAQALLDDFTPRIGRYHDARNYPAVKGPSYLSVHLRFGTISIRALVRVALRAIENSPHAAEGPQTWLSELIWRDFYMQILSNFPQVVRRSFRPEYDRVAWRIGPIGRQWLGDLPWDSQGQCLEDPDFAHHLTAWREGHTGYPIVDAAMRQLNQTGYMHNRLRMIVASFLTKDLEIHWIEGERYFAQKLNDYDLAANNGGWQWAASTGCDAQPYFRIFNPISQSEKFDPKGEFIARYVPELAGLAAAYRHAPWKAPEGLLAQAGLRLGRDYPLPIVDHDQARKRTLERFSVVKASA